MRVLVIDNYDSFTYNLVQAIGGMGHEVEVFRNDRISPAEVAARRPDRVVVSPGPCTPREAGVSCAVIRELSGRIPILGVCLGHQCIADVFGAKVVRASRIMHGKTSQISHDGRGVFRGLANPFEATRYHSLLVPEDTVPDCLEVSARTVDQGEVMGLRHRTLAVEGVQFHPESFLTAEGPKLLANFFAEGLLPVAAGR
ncbi:MAG TPA: aminodeoxychorismate/anthranilate synthase component II [Planctomycetota bacterium]|nr:aminodeoxychorismate/anthranilate synthase component II [Planctomycetota bacterium]